MNAGRFLKALLFAPVFIIQACDLESANDSSAGQASSAGSEPVEYHATGGAAKGIIRDARVLFDERSNGEWVEIATTWTDQDGRFDSSVTTASDVVRIRIEAESGTTMVCDAVSGCSGGVEFGDAFHVDPAFGMTGMVPAEKLGSPLSVNPMTHMASNWLIEIEDITPQTIEVVHNRIADLFGGGKKFVYGYPIDITDINQVEAATHEEREVAWVLGAIANASGGMDEAISIVDLMAEGFREAGGKLVVADMEEIALSFSLIDEQVHGDFESPTAGLNATVDSWSGVLSDAPLRGSYSQAGIDQVVAILDGSEKEWLASGINKHGTYIQDRIDENEWLLSGNHGNNLSFSPFMLWMGIAWGTLSDVALEYPEYHDDVMAMIDDFARDGTITAGEDSEFSANIDDNGRFVNSNVLVTPFLQGARSGGHRLFKNGKYSHDEAHLDGIVDSNFSFVHPGMESFFETLMYWYSPFHETRDVTDVENELHKVMDELELYTDHSINVDIYESGDVARDVDFDIDFDLDVDMLGYLTGNPTTTITINSMKYQSAYGDRLQVRPESGGMTVTIGEQLKLKGLVEIEGFGFPALELSLDLEQPVDGKFRDTLKDLVATSVHGLDGELMNEVIGMLQPSLGAITGTIDIQNPAMGVHYGLSFSEGLATVVRDDGVGIDELSFRVADGLRGYIFSDDELLGIAMPAVQGVGVELELIDGSSRTYLIHP